jgi:hypothetical protein
MNFSSNGSTFAATFTEMIQRSNRITITAAAAGNMAFMSRFILAATLYPSAQGLMETVLLRSNGRQ